MVATRQARAAASASAARAARLFESLDLGVLSVVASFGYPEELVELGVALHTWVGPSAPRTKTPDPYYSTA